MPIITLKAVVFQQNQLTNIPQDKLDKLEHAQNHLLLDIIATVVHLMVLPQLFLSRMKFKLMDLLKQDSMYTLIS